MHCPVVSDVSDTEPFLASGGSGKTLSDGLRINEFSRKWSLSRWKCIIYQKSKTTSEQKV